MTCGCWPGAALAGTAVLAGNVRVKQESWYPSTSDSQVQGVARSFAETIGFVCAISEFLEHVLRLIARELRQIESMRFQCVPDAIGVLVN